ncbi:MAG: NADPH-dependent glutamate synthase [Holophagales bacterium]|nr:NADPH-dependent glutamate synthase [Holophagales bacterium]
MSNPIQTGIEASDRSGTNEEGYLIVEKRLLAPETWGVTVIAPMVAFGRKPGQFFMLQPFEQSERIPLTLAGGNAERGTIRFVMMESGATTKAMGKLNVGDRIFAVAGPMGQPTELRETGTVVLMAGGYGSAAILPAAEELYVASRRVIVILGGRCAERVLLADELEKTSSELIITTDDGSLGRKGIVTDVLKEVMEREPIGQAVAVGPLPMMRAVSELTRPMAIPTLVSLNSLMIDGTGMCGCCRVRVGGEIKFACFHGPDFDGHKVDFESLRRRQNWYEEAERVAAADHVCRIGRTIRKTFEFPEPGILETEATADFDWKTADLCALKAPQRMKIPRQAMACQPPAERVTNFREVSLGLSHEQAKIEAARCIQCKAPECAKGCPVNIDIPAFIYEIAAGNPLKASQIIKRDNPLGSVCGRVCPQEKQCEAICVLGVKGQPVSIGRLERYASDIALGSEIPTIAETTGKRAAVVGAGPAGLTAAGDLIRFGHEVVVYEGLAKAGGVLRYGIPEFRLPNSIVDAEVQVLKAMGVQFVMDTLIGRSLMLYDLREKFDSVFLGTGAGLPKLLGVPGEDLKGVYTANEFLTRVNLMRADMFPEYGTPVTVGKHVIVVGCGNTAMDAARCSRRLGANVTVVYRRSVAESTARQEELEHAMEEGVVFKWLTTPVALNSNENSWVKDAECAVMELTEPGGDGRRGVRDTGERLTLPCDTLIVALGCAVNPLIAQEEKALKTQRGGVLTVDDATGETSLPGVFAAGDVITGGATVILAMGQARRAAAAMHRYMGNSL